MGRVARATRLTGGGIYAVLALALGVAAFIPEFRSLHNLGNVATQSAALGILAVGQTFVVLCGLIDLSVGQLTSLIVVLACDVMAGRPSMAGPAVLLALGLGVGTGAVTGLLHNRLRIHSLILTFGMMSVLQGAVFTYTDRSVGRVSPAIAWLADGRLLGVPVAPLLIVALATLGHLALTRTRFGLHVYAVGGNPDNARRAGIDTAGIALAAFVISGFTAGIAGLLVAGRLGTGYPHAGAGFELDAIVAVVLGGTSLAGGRGSIPGTLAAVLLLGLTNNVLNLLQISSFIQMLLKGLIVIGAILINQPLRRSATA